MPHDSSDARDLELLADRPLDEHDAHVLATLRRAATARDPVPAGLIDRITFGVALDEVYAEVAVIQRGRHLAGAGVRSADTDDSGTSTMTFSSEHVVLTITVSRTGREGVRIDGWLTGFDHAAVALRIPGETRREAAPGGRFWFDGVPRGQVQLLVEDVDGDVRMITPAVDL